MNSQEHDQTIDMINPPLISIIMPMYNASRFVEEAIASVLAQDFKDWELIIVDDASTDNSAEIVRKMMAVDASNSDSEEEQGVYGTRTRVRAMPDDGVGVYGTRTRDLRIHLLTHPHNQGISAARNTAIAAARGRYLAFLDSDDVWKPERLSKQMNLIEEKKRAGITVPFVFGGCDIIDETGRNAGKTRHVPETITYQELLKGNEIPCLTVLIDREAFPEEILRMPSLHHADYACWLRLLRSGATACGIDEVLASYRVSSTSKSANKIRTIGWQWRIYREQEHLSSVKSLWCLANYIVRGIKKRV